MEVQASPDAFRNHSLLRVTPTLMNIDNLSLQSLGKFNRGVGVSDLRDALEGRSSMSNPALVAPRPSSVNTFDRTTSVNLGSTHNTLSVRSGMPRRAVSTTTRSKKRVPGAPREVKDALDKLGIGSPKMNGSSLKASLKSPSNKSESPCDLFIFPTRIYADQGLPLTIEYRFRLRNSNGWNLSRETVAMITLHGHTAAFQTKVITLYYNSVISRLFVRPLLLHRKTTTIFIIVMGNTNIMGSH